MSEYTEIEEAFKMGKYKDLRTVANMISKYTLLAELEYELGNVRQARTLYRRGKKMHPDQAELKQLIKDGLMPATIDGHMAAKQIRDK